MTSPPLTAEVLAKAREEATTQIQAITNRKNHAQQLLQEARQQLRETLASAYHQSELPPQLLRKATSLSQTSIVNARTTNNPRNHATPGQPATLLDVETQVLHVQDATTDYDEARQSWTNTLQTEHQRGLLRPQEIYKAANITKQAYHQLMQRTKARQERAATTPAHTQLPPDDLPTTTNAYGPSFTPPEGTTP